MTRADHPSGTDRVAEVAAGLAGAQLIVNIQGDEPEVSIEAVAREAGVSRPMRRRNSTQRQLSPAG